MMTQMEENRISKYRDEVVDRDKHVVMTSMDSSTPLSHNFAEAAADGDLNEVTSSLGTPYGQMGPSSSLIVVESGKNYTAALGSRFVEIGGVFVPFLGIRHFFASYRPPYRLPNIGHAFIPSHSCLP